MILTDLVDERLLGAQHALVRGALERKGLGLLDAVTAGTRHRTGGGQPDECPTAEVGDQEVDLVGAHHLAEPHGDRLDGVDRGRRLHLVQERPDVDHPVPHGTHSQTLGAFAQDHWPAESYHAAILFGAHGARTQNGADRWARSAPSRALRRDQAAALVSQKIVSISAM